MTVLDTGLNKGKEMGSLPDVLPSYPVHNRPDGLLIDTKYVCQIILRVVASAVKLAYFQDFMLRQSRVAVAFTDRVVAMSLAIIPIVRRCAPPEIVKAVVGWVAIMVARLHALRTRTNKGHKNQSVNQVTFSVGQDHLKMARLVRPDGLERHTSLEALHTSPVLYHAIFAANMSKIRDRICTLKARYRFPDLFAHFVASYQKKGPRRSAVLLSRQQSIEPLGAMNRKSALGLWLPRHLHYSTGWGR